MQHSVALAVTVTAEHEYADHEVRLSGYLIGYRKWDGSSPEETADEVLAALAVSLGAQLGWPREPADGQFSGL